MGAVDRPGWRHCEERSDVAILLLVGREVCYAGGKIAALPSGARNDGLKDFVNSPYGLLSTVLSFLWHLNFAFE